MFEVIRKTAPIVRMLPTFTLNCEEVSTWWKWNNPLEDCVIWTPDLQKDSQFPDDPVRIKDSHIHYVNTKTSRRTNNRRYKDDSVRGTIITVCVVLTYFVRSSLIKWSCKSFGYRNNSMSPHHWPRILITCCVFTVCVVWKRSVIGSTTQSWGLLTLEWTVQV